MSIESWRASLEFYQRINRILSTIRSSCVSISIESCQLRWPLCQRFLVTTASWFSTCCRPINLVNLSIEYCRHLNQSNIVSIYTEFSQHTNRILSTCQTNLVNKSIGSCQHIYKVLPTYRSDLVYISIESCEHINRIVSTCTWGLVNISMPFVAAALLYAPVSWLSTGSTIIRILSTHHSDFAASIESCPHINITLWTNQPDIVSASIESF